MNSPLLILDQLKSKTQFQTDPDQEGWMVSYADLITLLFIFFSVMLSISSISKAKMELLSHQFNKNNTTSLTELKESIDTEIKKQNLQAGVSTAMTDEGLQVQFNERILFPLGEATLRPEGLGLLKQFAKILTGLNKDFHLAVEGHTDHRPIHTAAFPSNWELSSSRAVNVLHYLSENGVDEKKMVVRAYADTRPLADTEKASPQNQGTSEVISNPGNPNSEDSIARNRRVNLLVF